MLKFGSAECDQMKKIENELAAVLAKYRNNTEAALVVFACVRTARVLLRLYPEKSRQELTGVITEFLADRGVASTTSPLTMS